ncbi:hypothetical protein FIV50_01050 [Microbacterium foliorum]|uniref:Uncharacterized protein n=1 Tax=Microbacterium foliorum TaxID=104336 RepID=A0A4Y5YL39_9MICO|nr:hypothetical protein [Microbacterium foliorum]QDE33512.1 hypothetical protein FIV50_01050 [Microbacterium foliorum]
MATKTARIKAGFTLGGEQAEADPLAGEAFVESGLYEVIADRRDPRCFLIGRTGSGKSAALQHLEDTEPDHVIRITPEDLSLPYITDLQVIRYMDSLDVKLDLFWIALWKHVLLVEIIRHRYGVTSPETKQRFLVGLKERLVRQPGKQAALDYLDEFEGKFWCDADERVREITDRFTERLGVDGSVSASVASFGVKGAVSSATEQTTESKSEMADRYQRIVNETQLSKLNQMLTVLNDEILDEANFTYVVIDDLDRDWVDERLSNDLIRCLFRTVLDMQRVANLKIVVALRSNIFQELDFAASGGQEEKFRALVLEMRWTKPLLEEVLDERVKLAAESSNLTAKSFRDLTPHSNNTRGNPIQYILQRTLLRPRDAIAFANQCFAVAAGKHRLSWEDIQAAERQYSANRLLALRDEWKQTYPGIDQVVVKFRGAPARMTRDEFQDRLDECMLLMTAPEFTGVRWMTDLSRAMWESSAGEASWNELYQPLLALLYRIGLVGCALTGSAAPLFFADDALLVESESTVDRCEWFHVHRMFHKALDVVRTGERREQQASSAPSQSAKAEDVSQSVS